MVNVIVIAPHPDDETLGCGGTLLKHHANGDKIHWLIGTTMGGEYSHDKVLRRKEEIKQVEKSYPFESVTQLDFHATKLDAIPLNDIIHSIHTVFQRIQPEIVYVPYRGDIHTDHAIIFDAAIACTKWFRHPYVRKILVYETLSETDFSMNYDLNGFRPNYFVNISDYLERKIEILSIFSSEVGPFPFPRSDKSVRSLAYIRGAASGFFASEAFMLLKEVIE